MSIDRWFQEDREIRDWVDDQTWMVLTTRNYEKFWNPNVVLIDHIVINGQASCRGSSIRDTTWTTAQSADRHCRNCLKLAEDEIQKALRAIGEPLALELDWPDPIDPELLATRAAGTLPGDVFFHERPDDTDTRKQDQLVEHLLYAHGQYGWIGAHEHLHYSERLNHDITDLTPIWREKRKKPWWMT